MIVTILVVILIFSFLVLAHEFGHFITARRNGVEVEEFGIGFPPKVYSKKVGKTLYSFNALPLGGFVRLKGEQGESQASDSFASQRAWVKTKILMAGVTMNLLIAYLVITLLLIIGVPPLTARDLPSVAGVQPNRQAGNLLVVDVQAKSVAQQAGLKAGDRLQQINGETISTPEQLKAAIDAQAGKTISIQFKRGVKEKSHGITLPQKQADGALLGVSTVPEQLQSYPAYIAPFAAVVILFEMILATLGAFGGMIVGLFTRAEVSQSVTGPIGITAIFNEVIKYGPNYVLALVASISLSLAIINSLPLPALDGGRLLVVWLQRAGVKITDRTEAIIHTLGFVALIALMIIISVTDVMRLGGK